MRTSDDDYTKYAKYELSNIDDFYQISESKYVIYLYSDLCSNCVDIKGNLYDYLLRENETSYIYNMHTKSSEAGELNRLKFNQSDISQDKKIEFNKKSKPTNLENTYFIGTPSIYIIQNATLVDFIIGNRECANYFDGH